MDAAMSTHAASDGKGEIFLLIGVDALFGFALGLGSPSVALNEHGIGR
jgi:hypothetical protein